MSPIKLERRMKPSHPIRLVVTISSLLLALGFGGVVIMAIGVSPLHAYSALLKGGFGNLYGLSESLVKTVPLVLCGLSVALALKMKLWNIGAEGQYVIGALGASLVALGFPHLPPPLLLPAMILAALLAGGAWAGIAGFLRAFLGVSETITTLLLNWIAVLLAGYFVYGPLKGADGFPFSRSFCEAACLPGLGWGRLHGGLFLALLAAVSLYLILKKTVWGFEIKVIGANEKAARYAGMNISRNIFFILFLAGGMAGLAGFTEVAGIEHRLPREVAAQYGYTAILIAWLARTNLLLVVIVSFLFGGLLTGGEMVQIDLDVQISVVHILEGAILFFLLAGEFLVNYRLKLNPPRRKASDEKMEKPS